MRIGIISDTHDLLRPEVISHLQGCDCILHGGDISSRQVVDRTRKKTCPAICHPMTW